MGKANTISVHLMVGTMANQLSQMCKQLAADARNCGRTLGKTKADGMENEGGDSSPFDAFAETFEKGATDLAGKADEFNRNAQELYQKAEGSEIHGEALGKSVDAMVREATMKAVSEILATRIVPDHVRGAIDYSGITAVPRFGQPAPGSGGGSANVDPALAKIAGIEQ